MRKKILGIRGLGAVSALAFCIVLLLTMVVMRSGCDCGTLFATPEDEYEKTRGQIQESVVGWVCGAGIGIPPHGVMINTSNTSGCKVYIGTIPKGEFINAGYVLDLCYLVEYTKSWADESFYMHDRPMVPLELPICCYGQSGQEGTNFYTGSCSNPYSGHYIWLVDEVGNVCSVCVGDDCWANNESGYQGVWP